MSEIVPLLETLLAEVDAGRRVGLCAVLATRGSTPQSPGACMLVREDFSTTGTLGGGCVEAEVRRQAFEYLRRDASALLEFVLDHDYGWDDGLICGGQMTIGMQPIGAREVEPFRAALADACARRPAAFPLCVAHEGRRLRYRVLLEVPPTLVIAGAGHVGQAVARLAVDLDFAVTVIDDRAEYASVDRFPPAVRLVIDDIPGALRRFPFDAAAYVVIVTRGHRHDHQALAAVVRRPAGYIGLIGSRRKSKLILDDLAAAGVEPALLERVHTPIGLAIGARTVAEIAVSIAAELIQHRRRQCPSLVEGPEEPPAPGGGAAEGERRPSIR